MTRTHEYCSIVKNLVAFDVFDSVVYYESGCFMLSTRTCLEYHPLRSVPDCLFYIFVATVYI